MAGLLDDLLGSSFDDPKTQGNFALAHGLLSDPRAMRGLTGGLLARQDTIRAAKQAAMQEQMQQLQVAQMMQKQSLLAPILGGLAGGSGSSLGGMQGAMQGGIAAPQGQPDQGQPNAPQFNSQAYQAAPPEAKKSFLMSMPLEHVAALKLAGVADLTNDWKLAHEGIKMDAGAGYKMSDGSFQSMPSVSQNGQASQVMQNPDGSYRIEAPQGALKTFGDYKQEESRINNQNTLVPTERLDRSPGTSPNSSIDQFMHGAPPSNDVWSRIQAAMKQNGDQTANFNIGGNTGALTAGGETPGSPKNAAQLEADKALALAPVQLRNKMLTDAHTENAGYVSKLSDTLRNEGEIQNRNAQILPLLQKFSTGGMKSEARISFANSIANSDFLPEGIRNSVAAKIAGGDPADGKVIENQLASAGIKTMLDSLDKEGKPNRAIFEALKNAQESVSSGNATLKQIFGLQKQLYDWHYEQHQSAANKIAAPGYNPLTFSSDIAKERNDSLNSMLPAGGSAASAKPTHRYNPATGKVEQVQ